MNEVAATLEIRLLGQADVVAAGRSVKFAKRATTLAMIAYLVMRRGQAVARDFLAYTLFPDHDEEAALADLRRYLYLAAKALPAREDEPWLIVDSETIRWNNDAGATVDALIFEHLARDESTHARAIELYGGDLLEDVYDDWIVIERERLRALYLQVLGSLIARHREAREYALALGYAHRLLAADTWREDVARQVMAIRYAWGDTPGALGEYDRFVKRLRDEMNIGPMPETIALREVILCNGPLLGVDRRPQTPEKSAHPGRVLPFVGRESERMRLRQNWDRAARGHGNVVIVSGEAGIGKTRLVGELAHLVETEGGRAYCGATSFPESPPYQCLVDALRSALPVLTAHPMAPLTVGVLSRVLPELHVDSPVTPEVAALAPEREAARLLDALARAFVHIAASRPLLLVFEDLHWASDTTTAAIAMIGRRISKTRALVVGTYRDEETSVSHPVRRLVNALGAERRVTHLHLDRLGRTDVGRLLEHVEGLAGNDAAVVDRFYAFSEGNPLFVNEAIADALEGAAVPPVTVTSGVRSVIAARVDRLSDNGRTVAEIAAVCGHGCSVDVVRDVAGLARAETLAGFNELLDRRLIREAGARERFDFVFTHHLIGTSIYERMNAALRIRRHARTAHVIEQQSSGAEAARELARHYDLAGMSSEAAHWCIRAAREAAAVYANDDAVRFATTALDHVAGNVEALLLREEANARLAERDAQRADLDDLERLNCDVETRCHILRRRALLARALGERSEEREAVRGLRSAAAEAASPYWEAVAACAEARFHVAAASYEEAKVAARDALVRLDETGAVSDRIDALSALIEACASTGEFAEANDLLAQAQSIAQSAGDAAAVAETLMQAAAIAMPQQRFEDVVLRASEAVERFRAIGDRVGEARALANVATASLRLSRWREAREANRVAAEIFEVIGDPAGLARVLMNLGMLHGRCGDLGPARALIKAAREHHIQLGDERARTASLLNESFLALWQGQPQSAKALADEALVRARAIGHAAYHAQALANVGAAERDLDRIDDAIAHMEEGLALQLELGRMANAVSDLADIALAHARRGDLPAAVRLAERVLTLGSPWTDSAIFPPYPPWVVACIFHWSRDPRAAGVLAAADDVARSFASSIDVQDLRAQFERLPFFREIADAVANDRWPEMMPARSGDTGKTAVR